MRKLSRLVVETIDNNFGIFSSFLMGVAICLCIVFFCLQQTEKHAVDDLRARYDSMIAESKSLNAEKQALDNRLDVLVQDFKSQSMENQLLWTLRFGPKYGLHEAFYMNAKKLNPYIDQWVIAAETLLKSSTNKEDVKNLFDAKKFYTLGQKDCPPGSSECLVVCLQSEDFQKIVPDSSRRVMYFSGVHLIAIRWDISSDKGHSLSTLETGVHFLQNWFLYWLDLQKIMAEPVEVETPLRAVYTNYRLHRGVFNAVNGFSNGRYQVTLIEVVHDRVNQSMTKADVDKLTACFQSEWTNDFDLNTGENLFLAHGLLLGVLMNDTLKGSAAELISVHQTMADWGNPAYTLKDPERIYSLMLAVEQALDKGGENMIQARSRYDELVGLTGDDFSWHPYLSQMRVALSK